MPDKPLPISLEFFPGKTAEGAEKIRTVRQALYGLKPEFCSVTYGAGGSTQEGTFSAVAEIQKMAIDREVRDICTKMARRFEELGCIVEEASPDIGSIDDALNAARNSGGIERLGEFESQMITNRALRDLLRADDGGVLLAARGGLVRVGRVRIGNGAKQPAAEVLRVGEILT